MCSVDVVDTEFRFSHGKSPRGRGSWAFEIVSPRTNFDSRPPVPVFFPSSTFAVARRAAVMRARTAARMFGFSHVRLSVCP